MGIYGPRTIFLIAVKDFPGTHEFVLQDDGKWMLVKETNEIGALFLPLAVRVCHVPPLPVWLLSASSKLLLWHMPMSRSLLLSSAPFYLPATTEYAAGEGKMFSPGNLRATFDNAAYERLLSHYIGEKYTLRYTGGMVPDVFQIIVKEKGVFTNVSSPSTKAKLRILFEVAPLALLVRPSFPALTTFAAPLLICICLALSCD